MPTVVHVVSAVFDESTQAAVYLSARDDPHVHLEHVMWRLCVPPSPVLSVPATAAVTPPCQFIHSPIHPFMHPCIHSSIHLVTSAVAVDVAGAVPVVAGAVPVASSPRRAARAEQHAQQDFLLTNRL